MQIKDLKKNDIILSKQLGIPISDIVAVYREKGWININREVI